MNIVLKAASRNRGCLFVFIISVVFSDLKLRLVGKEHHQGRKNDEIRCSMTETYDPYQNAIAERVNGILKQEFILGIKVSDIGLMKRPIEQSIYIYNNKRPHWSCRMNTPANMHQQEKVKIKTYRNKNRIELKPDAI